MATIVTYNLRLNGGGFVDFVIDVGLATDHTFTGLNPSITYFIEVRDLDSNGQYSAWSPAVDETTGAESGGGGGGGGSMPLAPLMAVDESGDAWVDGSGGAVTVYV